MTSSADDAGTTPPEAAVPLFMAAREPRHHSHDTVLSSSSTASHSSVETFVLLPPACEAGCVSPGVARRSSTLAGLPVVAAELPQHDGTVLSRPSLRGLGRRGCFTRTPSLPAKAMSTPHGDDTLEPWDEGDSSSRRVKRSATADFGEVRQSSQRNAAAYDDDDDDQEVTTLEGWVKQRLSSILGMEESLRAFSLSRADHVEEATSRRHLLRGSGGGSGSAEGRAEAGAADGDRRPQGKQQVLSARDLLGYSYVKTIKRLTSRNRTKVLHQAASVAEDYMADIYESEPVTSMSAFAVSADKNHCHRDSGVDGTEDHHDGGRTASDCGDQESGIPLPFRNPRGKLLRRTQSTR